MFTTYVPLHGQAVYTASGEAIPVIGCGTVGRIPNCLHVPQLEKDLLSIPHLDEELGWRAEFGGGHGIVRDTDGKELFRGVLDSKVMLYMVNIDDVVGAKRDADELAVEEARELALAVMTKGEYENQLHDTFHTSARRLESMVTSGVVAWPFDPTKVKPIGFQKVLSPCDACGIGKSTRATFHGKVMTEITVGSVWQTDISGKWATPSL